MPSNLIDLLSIHQTTDIKHVCEACEKVLNAHKSQLQTVTSKILLGWFKNFIETKRSNAMKVKP